ncbi:MAG: cysteine protease, partial [Bacteroidetes bacterium]
MQTLLAMCLLAPAFLIGQPYATGLNFDDAAYEELPITANLMSRDYSLLPRSYSLKAFAPTPGSQGTTGTCTAWATAYHARTILEAVKLGLTDRSDIDEHAFSVSYVYNQIRDGSGCDEGTWIWDALNLMQTRGVPRAADFGFSCDRPVSDADHRLAREFRIEGYKRLHSTQEQDKITPIKKCLTQDKPVVFCMHLPPSFYEARERWEPAGFEKREPQAFGGHAMVIVGYDDSRDGGSFEVMNSWGTERWGNRGFTWVRYEDYALFARYAFELIEGVKPGMNEVVLNAPDLGGDFSLALANGGEMQVRYDTQAGMYRSRQGYPSGTLFQLVIGNKQPAYVYAF